MTVAYSEGIRMLKKWHGSVWKAVWKDLFIWLILYYLIRILIQYLPTSERDTAKKVVKVFNEFAKNVPVSFLLGFYVGQVVTRWWSQVNRIPWPDEIMLFTNANFSHPRQKHIRQTVARWLILCQAMVFRRISTRMRRRFPKLDSLIQAGLLTAQECEAVRNTQCMNNRWQLPLHWIAVKVIAPSDLGPPLKGAYLGNLNKFGDSLRSLFLHDWVAIPLVYAQTCTVVVYGYLLFCAIGHQYEGMDIDLYVPWFSMLQLIFYVGWLKVGQDLMRPFGEDDDDVELNCVLDRNAAVAMNLADQAVDECPDLIDDPDKQQEFVNKMLTNLAYSKASLQRKRDRHPESHVMIKLKEHEREMVTGLLRTFSPDVKLPIHDERTNVAGSQPRTVKKLKSQRSEFNLF